MSVANPIEVRQLALAKESVRGTVPAAPTSFLSVTKDSEIDFKTKLIEDPALRGVNARFPSFAGIQETAGSLKTPVRAQNIGEFLHMAFGNATSDVEQASFVVVTGTNDTIDFNIGGGNLVATVAAGTYIAGTNQATALSLCKAIYDAIVAAEAVGVYTVSFSVVTGLFTLTRTAGTFQLRFLTGPNTAKTIASLIGFTVTDQTGALTYTGTIVQTPPFKHLFTQGQVTQLPSYSFYLHRGINVARKQYNIGSVSKLKFSGTQEGPVDMDAMILAQKEADYAGAWSPVYSESPVLMFSDTTVEIAGYAPTVPNVKSWDCEFDPGTKEYRPLSQTRFAQDILAAGPFMAQGSMVVYFMDEVERAKFLAATQTSLEFIATGSLVAGGTVKYTLDLLLPSVEYEAFPFGDEDGFLGAKVKWRARYSTGSATLATAYVINSKVSY